MSSTNQTMRGTWRAFVGRFFLGEFFDETTALLVRDCVLRHDRHPDADLTFPQVRSYPVPAASLLSRSADTSWGMTQRWEIDGSQAVAVPIEWISVPDAAQLTGIHPTTLRYWIRVGRLHGEQLPGRRNRWFVRREDLANLNDDPPSSDAPPDHPTVRLRRRRRPRDTNPSSAQE